MSRNIGWDLDPSYIHWAPTPKGKGWVAHKSSSSPPPPDYSGAAAATAAGNMQALQYQTQANRATQETPWGTSSWTQGKNADGTDNNQWTQNVTLTPAQQQALNNQMGIQNSQSQLAQGLQGQVASTMQGGFNAPTMGQYLNGVGNVNQNFTGFTNTTGQADPNAPKFDQSTAQAGTKAAYDSQMSLIQPQMQQDTTNLDAKLRLQGLTPGTEAYNNAVQNQSRTQAQQINNIASNSVLAGNQMANQNYASSLAGYNAGNAAQNQNFGQSLAGYGANQTAQQSANQAQGQAYQQGINSYGTAYSSALQNYLQPLNSMNAVLSGQQVQNPTMPGYNQAGQGQGANYTQAASALGQWNSGIAAQNQANQSSNNSLLGTGITAAAMYFSDARLKKNIQKINVTEGGHNWYSWDWKDGSGSATGVIAQEILQSVPGAVQEAANGYYMVDYGQLA